MGQQQSNKTGTTCQPVDDFLATVMPEERRHDAVALDQLFQRITGFAPRMWGASIIGYGRYHYVYESGRTGDAPATGFSPRKPEQVLYVLPQSTDCAALLNSLGRHRVGKSCLYIRRLADVDTTVLETLIRTGLEDIASRWTVHDN